MIAQFCFDLPFHLAAPQATVLPFQLEIVDGEPIEVRFAARTEAGLRPPTMLMQIDPSTAQAVEIDGGPAVRLDLGVVEIHGVGFNRDRGVVRADPPVDIALRAINALISRVRALSRAPFVVPLLEGHTSWSSSYLDDARQRIQGDEGHVGARITISSPVAGVVSIIPASWAEIGDVSETQVTRWGQLILDATQAMPDIGAVLVLAYAAVESCAFATCSALAEEANVPPSVWNWILGRRPRVGDYVTTILEALGTTSLTADADLYQGFDNLRMARNQFCHSAVARDRLGLVTLPRAGELLSIADRVLAWLEERLPTAQRRPVEAVVISTSVTTPLYRVPDRPLA